MGPVDVHHSHLRPIKANMEGSGGASSVFSSLVVNGKWATQIVVGVSSAQKLRPEVSEIQKCAIPSSTAGTLRKNFRNIFPERPQKRSQSFSCNSPREYGWDPPPKPKNFKAFDASRASPALSPPQYGWGCFFFQKWFQRGPLRVRAAHGIPSRIEGISEKGMAQNLPASVGKCRMTFMTNEHALATSWNDTLAKGTWPLRVHREQLSGV